MITLLFSSLQNSEGVGDGDSGDSCADPPPPIFTISDGQNLTCRISPSLFFETFAKKLAEAKIVARLNVKKIKAKK